MIKIFENNKFLKKIKNIKHIEVYIAIIFIIVLLLIYFGDFTKSETTSGQTQSSYTAFEYADFIEEKLEGVLSNIKDAGKVSVMVSLESGNEKIFATSTEEKTNSVSSGSTTITTSEPIIITNQGSSSPIIIKEYMPKINGIIVVAQGADKVAVRMELLKAVQAIVDVPTTNISILVGNK